MRGLLIAVALILAAILLWIWFSLTWSYSVGERAGWVQKLSRKGWLCKTWEGEMAMVTMPGSVPEKFLFTVREEGVAAEINQLNGRRVSLRYEEKVGVPGSCFGDTPYFVTGVRLIDDSGGAPGLPARPSEPAGESSAPGAPGPAGITPKDPRS
jgi:hypothetical protein